MFPSVSVLFDDSSTPSSILLKEASESIDDGIHVSFKNSLIKASNEQRPTSRNAESFREYSSDGLTIVGTGSLALEKRAKSSIVPETTFPSVLENADVFDVANGQHKLTREGTIQPDSAMMSQSFTAQSGVEREEASSASFEAEGRPEHYLITIPSDISIPLKESDEVSEGDKCQIEQGDAPLSNAADHLEDDFNMERVYL